MLEVISKCFPQHIKAWEPKLREMIPAYGTSLLQEPALLREIQAETSRTLGLTNGNGASGHGDKTSALA